MAAYTDYVNLIGGARGLLPCFDKCPPIILKTLLKGQLLKKKFL